ncbi:uncharacterized protein AB675_4372 [Cyphellophora attinorum]|uniref:Uncharacterized protein n=1 Tax=Cyphellophora attinorum TaxID=1664694 RepID=A0A0N1GZN0_9EURO|nr:uncharacterized protein AB675_4372 [Phialophora attinorum]KPI36597.1 hypothetical protein AB675_4372 [Phialophora attinorum]
MIFFGITAAQPASQSASKPWYQEGQYDPDNPTTRGGSVSYAIIDQITYEGRTNDGSSGCITYDGKAAYDDTSETARRVIKDFFNAINANKYIFEINNSQLGGDPMSGARKLCTLYYRYGPDRPLLCQQVFEHEFMNFNRSVRDIEYGGVQVRNSEVVKRFNRALRTALESTYDPRSKLDKVFTGKYADDAVEVNNDNCGGDTNFGKEKTVKVWIGGSLMLDAQEGEKWPNVKRLIELVKR